jgi:hypothetical protein
VLVGLAAQAEASVAWPHAAWSSCILVELVFFLPLLVFVPMAMQPGYHQQLFDVKALHHLA